MCEGNQHVCVILAPLNQHILLHITEQLLMLMGCGAVTDAIGTIPECHLGNIVVLGSLAQRQTAPQGLKSVLQTRFGVLGAVRGVGIGVEEVEGCLVHF